MKTIKIKFDGFTSSVDASLNREAQFILSLLRRHYNVEISDAPDYIFCNVNSREYYNYDGVRIFCTIEAICPDFNLCDYGIGFEYMDFGDRYFRFPNFGFYSQIVSAMVDKHKKITDDLAERKFCSFVYSNARADDMREKLYHCMNGYHPVDSGGRYLNNQPDEKPVENKMLFESMHKFSIACENAMYPGYHTEKIVEAFAAGTVPIYWGDPKAGDIFNKNAYIDVNDYDSLEDVVERVKELNEDTDLYLSMLKEPALKSGNIEMPYTGTERGEEIEQRQIQRLEAYLMHIFEQPLEQAYRRNRGFWGRQYLQGKKSVGGVIEKYNALRDTPIAKVFRKYWRR